LGSKSSLLPRTPSKLKSTKSSTNFTQNKRQYNRKRTSHRTTISCQKRIKKITKIASDIRRKEQEMKAAKHGIAGQTDKEKVLKMIIDREQMRLEYKYLQNILKSMQTQPITSIAIPKNNGTTEILTNPTEVHEAIINQNIKHFTTPEASPLELGEFLHKPIGKHVPSDFSNRVP
jgi:hypothetical protein